MQIQKKMKPKRGFTLLELCVALSILLLVAGVVGWQVKGAVERHGFESSVDRFVLQLREMQSLALSYQSDMEVELSQIGQKITYHNSSDEPLKIIDRTCVHLKDVSKFLFNGKKRDALKFRISSNGSIEPSGVLHFHHKGANLYVDLSTPLLVKVTSEPPKLGS
jgi:prepilin-type N-terminal cleavage/methylation domain-containing protein